MTRMVLDDMLLNEDPLDRFSHMTRTSSVLPILGSLATMVSRSS